MAIAVGSACTMPSLLKIMMAFALHPYHDEDVMTITIENKP